MIKARQRHTTPGTPPDAVAAAGQTDGERKYNTMKEYSATAGGRALTIASHAQPLEIVYRSICYWFTPSAPVTITDSETGEQATFRRSLDNAGNLLQIITA